MSKSRKDVNISGLTENAINEWGYPTMPVGIGGEVEYNIDLYALRASAPNIFTRNKKNKDTSENEVYGEPGIIVPERSFNATSLQASRYGSNITVNDDEKYIQISHVSGSAIQVDNKGNILIKSLSDVHLSADTTFIHSEGDTSMTSGGGWDVMIEGGSGKIYIAGDMEIECEHLNLIARGSAKINAGQGVEIQGAKIGISGRDENVNIAGKEIRMASESDFSIGSSGGTVNVQAGSEINMSSGGSIYVDSDDIQLANGTNSSYKDPAIIKLDTPPQSKISKGPAEQGPKDAIKPVPGPITGAELDND